MNTEAEQQLLHHARNGNTEEVRKLLEAMERTEVIADIDCKGELPMLVGFELSLSRPHYSIICLIFLILPMVNLTPFSLEELPTILCEMSLLILSRGGELRSILGIFMALKPYKGEPKYAFSDNVFIFLRNIIAEPTSLGDYCLPSV